MRWLFVSAALVAAAVGLAATGQTSLAAKHHAHENISVFATGFNNPRGLTFGRTIQCAADGSRK